MATTRETAIRRLGKAHLLVVNIIALPFLVPSFMAALVLDDIANEQMLELMRACFKKSLRVRCLPCTGCAGDYDVGQRTL